MAGNQVEDKIQYAIANVTLNFAIARYQLAKSKDDRLSKGLAVARASR